MKTTIKTLAAALALLATPHAAQAQKRLVLMEEFTNTGCAPCAVFAPALDSLLKARINDVVAVKYHFNFPQRNDPYYLTNAGDIDKRGAYYGITGVPSVIINGKQQYAIASMLDGYIDQAMTAEKLIDMSVNASLKDHRLDIDVQATPVKDITGQDLRLFVAIVEEQRTYSEAFANGETYFYYVMQKLLPGGDGQPIGNRLTAGQPVSYNAGWAVENFADETELGIVSFIQDLGTGQVLETVYTPYPTGSPDAARIIETGNTPNHICNALFTSSVVIRNTGKNTMKSANVNVSINGQEQMTPWTGSLGHLDVDTIATPPFTSFIPTSDGTANDVRIWLSDINGTGEQSAARSVSMSSAPTAVNSARLSIVTDNKPEETTWQLYNSAGDLVTSGGPYTEARRKYTTHLPLDTDDCYTIEFGDAGNDGISGAAGNGYYKLDQLTTDGKTRMLVQATYTGAGHTQQFSLQNADISLGIEDIEKHGDTPATLYDTMGNKIASAMAPDMKNAIKGLNLKGVFLLKTGSGGNTTTKKLIIE